MTDAMEASLGAAFHRWAERCQDGQLPASVISWAIDEMSAGGKRIMARMNPKRPVLETDWQRVVDVLEDDAIPLVELPDRYLLALEGALLGTH